MRHFVSAILTMVEFSRKNSKLSKTHFDVCFKLEADILPCEGKALFDLYTLPCNAGDEEVERGFKRLRFLDFSAALVSGRLGDYVR